MHEGIFTKADERWRKRHKHIVLCMKKKKRIRDRTDSTKRSDRRGFLVMSFACEVVWHAVLQAEQLPAACSDLPLRANRTELP